MTSTTIMTSQKLSDIEDELRKELAEVTKRLLEGAHKPFPKRIQTPLGPGLLFSDGRVEINLRRPIHYIEVTFTVTATGVDNE